MKNWYPACKSPESSFSTGSVVKNAATGWLISGEIQGWSRRTIDDRRAWIDRLVEFLNSRELDFSLDSLRLYFLALGQGNEGRCRKPLRPASVKHVHSLLSAFS